MSNSSYWPRKSQIIKTSDSSKIQIYNITSPQSSDNKIKDFRENNIQLINRRYPKYHTSCMQPHQQQYRYQNQEEFNNTTIKISPEASQKNDSNRQLEQQQREHHQQTMMMTTSTTQMISTKNNISGIQENHKDVQINKTSLNDLSENDFIFGSTPRGNSTDCINLHHQNENESDNNISSCSTLDIDNKVKNNPINDLENQVNDLKKKLKISEKECIDFKRKLSEAIEEKERSHRRLEVISSAHESRITEMHCVIAELSKKLRNKQELTIFEENEQNCGGSEFSFQEGSVYNSENNLTNPDAECQTEPIESEVHPISTNNHIIIDTATKTQVEALQEEVLHLKARIALLQSQIANKDSSPEAIKNDNDKFLMSSPKEKSNNGSYENYDDELDEDDDDDNNINDNDNDGDLNVGEDNLNDKYKQRNSAIIEEYENPCAQNSMKNPFDNRMYTYIKSEEKWASFDGNITSNAPIAKMAERVKLRKTTDEHHITGTDLLNSEINNTDIVEHLVSDMIQSDNILNGLNDSNEIQNELQRLQRRIEHLKIKNSVLTLTLDECKEHCGHLYLLCGKYESNAIALQLALNCSDRAIEAYDVMLALLESKLALLQEKNAAAEDSRRSVEAVARHLLDRLESEKNLTENSMGPWQNNFSINSSQITEPWTIEDDNRLRNHVSKLKGRRSAVQNTVVELESPFSSEYSKFRNTLEMKKDKKTKCCSIDIEMAVLMQELVSLREEIAESKQKVQKSEREKRIAIEKIYALEEALSQLQTQFMTESETPLSIVTKDRHSYSEAEHAAIIERQLVEALTRESQLKNRIQALVESVSATKKSSDEKYIQVQNNIAELQKKNMDLMQCLEMCKRKYRTKIKCLELKITDLSLERKQLKGNEIVPETTL